MFLTNINIKKFLPLLLVFTLLGVLGGNAHALFKHGRKHRLTQPRNAVIYSNPPAMEGPSGSPSPAVQSVQPAGDELLIRQLRKMEWRPFLPGAKKLALKDILQQTEASNLNIALSQEKLEETEAKEKGVANKRLLFFFKFFNAEYLEGSAEDDVAADKAHIQVETNKAFLESCQRYYMLISVVMSDYIAYQSIRQGVLQLDFNKARFVSGETTNVDVLETKAELIRRYQTYLKSESAYQDASLALLQQLNLPFDRWVYPADLKFYENRFLLPILDLLPATLDTEKAVKIALKYRPELDELDFRETSLKKLIQASALDKAQQRILDSSFRQLKIQSKMMQQGIEAATRQAAQDYQVAQDKMALTLQELQVAEIALKQVQISQKAGFSSNKDVLDAQINYGKAQVDHSNAIVDYNLSQIKLLYALGLLQPDTLLEEKELNI